MEARPNKSEASSPAALVSSKPPFLQRKGVVMWGSAPGLLRKAVSSVRPSVPSSVGQSVCVSV